MKQFLKLLIRKSIRCLTSINIAEGSHLSIPFMNIAGGRYVEIGTKSKINRMAWIAAIDYYQGHYFKPTIKIGSGVSIGNYFCITAIDNVVIDDGCLLSEYVYISDHAHGTNINKGSPVDQPLYSKGPVYIGENTFIGYRASILPGVRLGKHCVVGAHSVVTKSFPDYSVIAGVPARLLKQNNSGSQTWYDATLRT